MSNLNVNGIKLGNDPQSLIADQFEDHTGKNDPQSPIADRIADQFEDHTGKNDPQSVIADHLADSNWLTTKQLAQLANLKDERNARIIVSNVQKGKTWRGHRLEIKAVEGRGGKSGISYRVYAGSLPPELYEKWYGKPKVEGLTVEQTEPKPAKKNGKRIRQPKIADRKKGTNDKTNDKTNDISLESVDLKGVKTNDMDRQKSQVVDST
ncbi:MAG: hypothetical protein DRQ99_24305, partial [Candidatus Parabeggiatoa sp. nov. 3]